MSHSTDKTTSRRRRAAMYVAVIGAAALVTVIGLTALTAVRIESKSHQGETDFLEAMQHARSAIDVGLYKVRSDIGWRATQPNGEWDLCPGKTKPCPIGGGTYSLTGADPIDGVLLNKLEEPLILTGTGWKGAARYKLEARVHTTGHQLTCLDVPLVAATNLSFASATVTVVGGPVTAHGNVTASLSTVTANTEAVGTISGSIYIGTKTAGIAPRTMPDGEVFDYYIDPAHGTAINLNAIPLVSGARTIQDAFISPTSNPYGAVNANGIYVIDCKGMANVAIKNSRIVGTIVVLDPSSLKVQQSVNWQPAASNYPALLVRGPLTLEYTGTGLLQALISYPSRITGLVYASGSVTVSNTVTIIGLLLSGQATSVTGTLALTYDSAFKTNPPPGFRIGNDKVEVVAGSWKRLVD